MIRLATTAAFAWHMILMILATSVLMLLFLIPAPTLQLGTASADTLDNQLAQLQPIAVQWWAEQGLTATRCDTIQFSRRDFGANDGTLAGVLEGTDLAHPQWPNERVAVCHIVFAERLTEESPARVCTTVIHEWGHILGLDHNPDPSNIMYWNLIDPPPVCAAWGAPPVKGTGSLTTSHGTIRHARWATVRAQRMLRGHL